MVDSVSIALPARPSPAVGPPHLYLALSPSILTILIFFALPMGVMIGLSFSDPVSGLPSLASYQRFLTDGLSLPGMFRTVVMSLCVAVCVTALGYPVAYYLARARGRMRAIVFALALAPELAGVVLRTYGWLIILEDRGFINDVLLHLGLIASPLPLSKTMFAVVVGLTHVVLPFGILSLMTSIQGIDPNLERAAQVLGASRASVMSHVLLPLSLPGIVSSLLIAFTMAASAYATPALLGGAGFKVLATMIAEQVLFYVNWPFAAVMANALFLMMLAVSYIGIRFEARRRVRVSGGERAVS